MKIQWNVFYNLNTCGDGNLFKLWKIRIMGERTRNFVRVKETFEFIKVGVMETFELKNRGSSYGDSTLP